MEGFVNLINIENKKRKTIVHQMDQREENRKF